MWWRCEEVGYLCFHLKSHLLTRSIHIELLGMIDDHHLEAAEPGWIAWLQSTHCLHLHSKIFCGSRCLELEWVSRVADRVLVLWPGVRPEPLRWESRVQDIGPPETSRPHVISTCESSPRDLHLNAKTQLHLMTSKLQCWTPHAKQLARQEHNPTH